jgi:hypothetical protein
VQHFANIFTPHNEERDQEIEKEYSSSHRFTTNCTDYNPERNQRSDQIIEVKKRHRIRSSYTTNVEGTTKKSNWTITYIFNGILRMSYWPKQFKISQIITIAEPGKDPTQITSYCPISLISVLFRVFEKLTLRRINKDLRPNKWIPHHQFGFCQGHSTIQQVHRITNVINKALEDRSYCTAVFLDVSQAFDRAWHSGLLY